MLAAQELSMVTLVSRPPLVFSMDSLVLDTDTPVTQIMGNTPTIITSLSCSQVFPIINSSFISHTSSQPS